MTTTPEPKKLGPRKRTTKKHDQLMLALARELRYRRTSSLMTQESLAKIVGVDRAQISNIEGGRSWPTLPVVIDICAATKSNPVELFAALAGHGVL